MYISLKCSAPWMALGLYSKLLSLFLSRVNFAVIVKANNSSGACVQGFSGRVLSSTGVWYTGRVLSSTGVWYTYGLMTPVMVIQSSTSLAGLAKSIELLLRHSSSNIYRPIENYGFTLSIPRHRDTLACLYQKSQAHGNMY